MEEALAADLLVTVTPGHEVVLGEGTLQPGQHVSLMGADGPGKAEAAGAELARARLFCDDWEQAATEASSHTRLRQGSSTRADVTAIGQVLGGEADGRSGSGDITLFDSTGLAIQDLAVALAAMESAPPDLPALTL